MTEIRPPMPGETPLSPMEMALAIRQRIKPVRKPLGFGVDKAVQGHLYRHEGRRVIAFESGSFVKVAPLMMDGDWFGEPYFAMSRKLTPLPMRYHGGQLP